MSEQPLLEVRDLHTELHTPDGVVQAVNTLSLTVGRGETVALLGESGCGKSMAALSLMRLVPEPAGVIVSGEVLFEGQDVLALPEAAMRRMRGRRIGMIFQEPMVALNPVMSVGAQIGEVLYQHFKIRGTRQRQRIIELLREVGIPEPERRLKAFPHQLSGGMQQRVGIAMALAGEPDLLIADEPTTALDVTIQAQILTLLMRLQHEHGMGLLMITHDLAVVRQVADRVAVMYAGHIVETAACDTLFSNPRHPYSRKLFASVPTTDQRANTLSVIKGHVPALTQTFTGCRFAERCERAWSDCFNIAPRVNDTGDANVRCHLYDSTFVAHAPKDEPKTDVYQLETSAQAEATNKPLLALDNVQVHFPIRKGLLKRTVGHVYAVDGVSLTLTPGRTLALVGESGCGKSTLARTAVRLEKPTGGTVSFDGQDLSHIGARALRRLRRDIQIIFQNPFASMNPRMRVIDIVQEGLRAQGVGANASERERRVVQLLDEVGLSANALDRYPNEFSGGQRQRIAIARALALDPRLIVCDEPTSALDVSVQAQVLNLLRSLQAQHQLTYLFISHNIAVVKHVADDIAVMYLGRIVEQGRAEDVLQAPKHPYTQALLASAPTLTRRQQLQTDKTAVEPPSPSHPPPGCHFSDRCPHVMTQCRQAYPATHALNDNHVVRCFLYSDKT